MKELHKPDAAFARLFLPQKLQPDTCYIPSQFVLPFSHNGRQYAFSTLTKQCLETGLPEKTHVGNGFDPLIKAMFLVPEDRDECAYYEKVSAMMRLYAGKKGISSYTVLPALGCNARCVYCYEEGRRQEKMTPETAGQAIRYILDTRAGDEVSLSWFGGEPLLCPEIIDRICGGLREAGVPYKSAVVTNGSLINAELLEKMLTCWNVKRVQISMDGAEPDYIARKRYIAGHDEYHTVMHAIDSLSAAGIKVSVRCNADEGNWPGIPRFLDDLAQAVVHKHNVCVYFSPLMDVRAGENDLAFWEKVIAARPLIEKAGFRPLPFMGPSMKLKVNRCMADGGGVVITPDGSLYPCEHCPPESRYGDIFHGITDEAAKKEFCRTDHTREMCRKCPFLPDCTSFASCPWKDAHCRQAHEMNTLDALKRMADSAESSAEEAEPEEDTIC